MRLKTRRDTSHIFINLDDSHIYRFMSLVEPCLLFVEIHATLLKSFTESRRVMYDDYDFDFSQDYDFGDSEEYDLDEDYARDGNDYQDLAYRHYA
jgi:hypothetical protein